MTRTRARISRIKTLSLNSIQLRKTSSSKSKRVLQAIRSRVRISNESITHMNGASIPKMQIQMEAEQHHAETTATLVFLVESEAEPMDDMGSDTCLARAMKDEL